MRVGTLSRRDMIWAAGALTFGAAFAESPRAPPNPAGLAQVKHDAVEAELSLSARSVPGPP